MKEKQELLNLIEIAFNQTLLPHINEVYENERCKIECIELLGVEEWKETILDDLVYKKKGDIVDVITCLSNKGFLYYLPAFLQFILVNYDYIDVLGDLIVSRLAPKLDGMNNPRASWMRNIYEALTDQQKECIQDVFLYLWDKHDDGLVDDALNNFWFEHPQKK